MGKLQRETIFAPATAPGRAGIAVVRISGPATDEALGRLSRLSLPAPRRASLRVLYDSDGGVIDQALVLRFAEGASYTGEAMAEIHCHGGRAVVAALLAALAGCAGCRLAEPGEFTRRAFEMGRVDLTSAEALADLLAAETELQRRQAVRGMSGALERMAQAWRDDLIQAAALVEVTIDWADEEMPESVSPEVATLVGRVRDGIARQLALSEGAERLRHGFDVAILGAPNVGKSSLFNVLCGRDAAITSDVPGTTRDVLELRYDLGGLPVVFLDTAGMREAEDGIEAIGVARAKERAAGAALRVFLRAPDAEPWPEEAQFHRDGDLRVWNKADVSAPAAAVDLAVSTQTGDGIADLLDRIQARLADQAPSDGLVGHLRQRRALEAAIQALASAQIGVCNGPAELVAEDLRTANAHLERLLGRIGVEEVLDAVFRQFCLGK